MLAGACRMNAEAGLVEGLLGGCFYRGNQFADDVGLGNVAAGAGLRGADGHFVGIVLGDENNLGVRGFLADPAGGFEAV